MLSRRHWIPPFALIYAQLAHGAAWLIVLWAAWAGNLWWPPYGFAWIHTVALAWVTMAALAILIHALPSFVDAPLRGESAARWSLLAYALGVALLIYGFFDNPQILGAAGTLVLAALLVYLSAAFATLAGAMRGERIPRAVARAFGGTFLFLFATALIGFALAWMLSGQACAAWVARLPEPHADLGTLGWLSLLIFGVSMRTLRPITGTATRFRWVHIVVGSFAALGVPLLAAGVGAHLAWLAWIGGALFALATLAYVFDVFDMIVHASNPHRPPQAFVVCSLLWFLTALALGGGILAGKPWQHAYVFVLLMGWVGQMVNAHIHHIGVRLLATVYRGEEDETPPQELLEARLSWFSWAASQLAVAAVTYALLTGDSTLAARGAIFGFGGWIAMLANLFAARMRAKVPPKTIVLR